MTSQKGKTIVASLTAVILAGGAGAVAAWFLVGSRGWSGLVSGIVGVLVAMVIAVLVFAVGVALLKAVGWIE